MSLGQALKRAAPSGAPTAAQYGNMGVAEKAYWQRFFLDPSSQAFQQNPKKPTLYRGFGGLQELLFKDSSIPGYLQPYANQVGPNNSGVTQPAGSAEYGTLLDDLVQPRRTDARGFRRVSGATAQLPDQKKTTVAENLSQPTGAVQNFLTAMSLRRSGFL